MTKYAVSLYGIGQDENENGERMGLTFGPAIYEDLGPGTADYLPLYKAHQVDNANHIIDSDIGLTEDGHAYRCIHHDS